MERPRFSELLVTRRHQLGLTVQQASRILKLKEQVLVAFEEGDFDNMPKSGYAQGMLSSYARYLGINPREVVDLYSEELYEYLHGTASHDLRRRTRDNQSGRGVAGYDVLNEADSRPKAYVEYRPLLPTGGGLAGDMGAFSTTSPSRPRGSSVPLVNSGIERSGSYSHAQYATGHAYNSEETRARSVTDPGAPVGAARRRVYGDQTSRLIREGQNVPSADRSSGRLSSGSSSTRPRSRQGSRYRSDDIRRRSVSPDQYTDDLLLDDEANHYEIASTRSGRRKSRNIASSDRPNVRRRQGSSRSGSRSARESLRRRGIVGMVMDFFSDGRRALALIVAVLALVLTVIIITSVRSCVSGKGTEAPSRTVEVQPVGTEDTQDTGDGGEGTESEGDTQDEPSDDDSQQGSTTSEGELGTSDQDASEGDASQQEGEGDAQESGTAEGEDGQQQAQAPVVQQETKVQVRMGSGEISWLEITCDGQSMVADTVTGPFNQTYTVTDSITIQAGDTSVVTVYENGVQRQFESKASGVGTITIQGTPVSYPQDEPAEDAAQG